MKNKIYTFFLLLLVLLLVFTSCEEPFEICYCGIVKGNVVFSDNTPIPNSIVTIEKIEDETVRGITLQSYITDDEGSYIFEDLCPGSYRLTINYPEIQTKLVTVYSDEITRAEDFIFTGTSSIYGTIIIDDDDEIDSGNYLIYAIGESGTYTSITDSDGFFLFSDIPSNEEYAFSVQKCGIAIPILESGKQLTKTPLPNRHVSLGNINLSSSDFTVATDGEDGEDGATGPAGPAGPAGIDGEDGLSIVWKGSYAPSDLVLASPVTNWAFNNTEDGNSYIFDGEDWAILVAKPITYDDYTVGTTGPAGGVIIYDCDADNGNILSAPTAGDDGLTSYKAGWRYIEAAPYDLRLVDATENEGEYNSNGTPSVDGESSSYINAGNGDFKDVFVYGDRSCEDDTIETGENYNDGKKNTKLIMRNLGNEAILSVSSRKDKNLGDNYAAKLCDELSYNGYEDWFLPSTETLRQILVISCRKSIPLNMSQDEYLSSCEESVDLDCCAFSVKLGGDGTININLINKNNLFGVRPVRSF